MECSICATRNQSIGINHNFHQDLSPKTLAKTDTRALHSSAGELVMLAFCLPCLTGDAQPHQPHPANRHLITS